ncbi:MAG: thioredoxin family protein [Owenweeksia sp.]|nr:thioredoxin family protein [Owenweeksia sp.]
MESRHSSSNEALQAAEEEGKPIFMDCYTTWCGPCKWMSANIFTQQEVGDYYNENYVCVKFDMEKVKAEPS